MCNNSEGTFHVGIWLRVEVPISCRNVARALAKSEPEIGDFDNFLGNSYYSKSTYPRTILKHAYES